jgi:VCBS repeat protein/tetratricopeptide repeat protein
MRRTTQIVLRAGGATLLALAACHIFFMVRWRAAAGPQQSPAAEPKPAAKKAVTSGAGPIQTHRNVGKAYYEQGKYAEAIGEFQKVIASGHALASDHLNLGLALMQANDLDAALGELTTARQMDPKLVAAQYNLGILYKRELRYPDAEAALQRVIAADPHDPAAWFNLGTVYFAEKKLELALDAHQRVVNMGYGRGQNFYVASLFHTFTLLVRLKRQAEAQKVLKIHEQVRDKVPNISLQNPALEAGKYGAILVPAAPMTTAARRPAPARISFEEITSKLGINLRPTLEVKPESEAFGEIKSSEYSLDFARRKLVAAFTPTVAVGDYDGDGHPDLYVTVPGGNNHLLHNNGDGTFADVTEKAGVAGPGGSLSASFADYDNSGHASLFVAGLGGVRLYHNNGDGTFTDSTEKSGLQGSPGELATRALLFDADEDGFLDLVVTVYADLAVPPPKDSFVFPGDFSPAKIHFYRNNGDGTFTERSSSAGLGSARGRWRNALFADFDNDGYADLLLLRDDGPPVLFINQGDRFVDRTAEAGEALVKSGAVDGQVADFNHDGNFDLCLWSPSGYQVLLNRGGARFEAIKHLPPITPPPARFAFRGTVADIDGDGFDDLLVNAGGIWRLILNRGGRFQEVPFQLSPGNWPSSESSASAREPDKMVRVLASLTPAWLSSPGNLDLLGTMPNGQLAVFEKQGRPPHWLEIKLDGYKSNKQGTGTVIEVKAGNFYSKVQATGNTVRVFTGDLAKLDVVRITWPNQIVQNSIDVATNKPLPVRESERLASSCPFLYVWDGRSYVFLTDILGVAPLGELLPDGSRLKPNPEEFVRLPAALPERDGLYTFQITDELREVDYVDQTRLLAIDHPAADEIYANEIYSSLPTAPALYAVHQKRFPISAVDEQGRDLLPLIREVDGRYPTDFRPDRILGLGESHALTLDLGDLPSASRVALYLTGWVFWTDSNASRALASNSKLEMIPPYLQVHDEQGRWVTVIPDMGLPSGTNRTMRVDLTGKFPSPDHHVRIVTNLRVYWDQIFFTTDDTPLPSLPAQEGARGTPPLHGLELPLASADLHYRGFSRPTSDPQHLKPDSFDYLNVLAEAPWNPMRGKYTRYGEVAGLLARADDRMVVMATGDELTVSFSGRGLPPLQPGWKRDFFLYVQGWAKDGEPNTAFSRTVEPLPFRQMGNYPPVGERQPDSAPYRRYLDAYETRPAYLLIPPLAPFNRQESAVSY